jgi:hypothetical protein
LLQGRNLERVGVLERDKATARLEYAGVPLWSGPERERGREKHESGERGDGFAASVTGNTLGRMKTRRATTSLPTLTGAREAQLPGAKMP